MSRVIRIETRAYQRLEIVVLAYTQDGQIWAKADVFPPGTLQRSLHTIKLQLPSGWKVEQVSEDLFAKAAAWIDGSTGGTESP